MALKTCVLGTFLTCALAAVLPGAGTASVRFATGTMHARTSSAHRLFVTIFVPGKGETQLWVLDPKTGKALGSIKNSAFDNADALAAADGKLYVTGDVLGYARIFVYDIETLAYLGYIATTEYPGIDGACAGDGEFFLPVYQRQEVYVGSLATGKHVASLPTGHGAGPTNCTAKNGKLVVSLELRHEVEVFDIRTRDLLTTLPLRFPDGVDAIDGKIFVVDAADPQNGFPNYSVSIFSESSFALLRTITGSTANVGFSLAVGGGVIYVPTNSESTQQPAGIDTYSEQTGQRLSGFTYSLEGEAFQLLYY